MKPSRLQSILTAAIVDYCQKSDLYIAELHIQGTVCISSDGVPTLVTQLSEKVSTNNNRWPVGARPSRPSPGTYDPSTEQEEAETNQPLTRFDLPPSKSPSRKNRRKSEPGPSSLKYSDDFHRDVQAYRWSVGSIRESDSPSKYMRSSTPEQRSATDESPERRPRYPHGGSNTSSSQQNYAYRTPKVEPLDTAYKAQHGESADLTTSQSVERHAALSSSASATTSAETSLPPAMDPGGGARELGQMSAGTWRHQHENRVISATAMAVYSYMQSPTYQGSDPHPSRALSDPERPDDEHGSRLGKGSRLCEEDSHLHLPRQHVSGSSFDSTIAGFSASAAAAAAAAASAATASATCTSASGNSVTSPHCSPHPSPHGRTKSPPEPHPPPLRSPSYLPPYRSSGLSPRDLPPLRLPLDYAPLAGPRGLSSPLSVKAEAGEELHVVTRPLSATAPHVPSMVSPSAQAAASAMAALSSLQASIMPPAAPQPGPTKESPTLSVGGRSVSTSSAGSQGQADLTASPEEQVDAEAEESSESPSSEPGSLDLAASITASGCLQIPDAPVNSHFRKMMLKSLQGKYKVLKTAEGRYKCPVCGVSYVYQPNLRKHLEKVHLGKSYKCEFCGQKFTSVQGYSFHRKVKHRDLMPYRCELCRDAFYSYTAFLQHKKRSHSNHPECVAIANNRPAGTGSAAAPSKEPV